MIPNSINKKVFIFPPNKREHVKIDSPDVEDYFWFDLSFMAFKDNISSVSRSNFVYSNAYVFRVRIFVKWEPWKVFEEYTFTCVWYSDKSCFSFILKIYKDWKIKNSRDDLSFYIHKL